jgi:tetratricopeptide (TPR) repeat protein
MSYKYVIVFIFIIFLMGCISVRNGVEGQCSACVAEGDWSQSANAFLSGEPISEDPIPSGPKAAREKAQKKNSETAPLEASATSSLDEPTAEDLLDKGVALYVQGNYSEAIKAYDEAIRLNPNLTEAWNNKGNALYAQGNYSDAIKCYEEAIRLDPNHAEAWNNKGIILEVLGNSIAADEAFAKAKELGYMG